jgi:hypothetical protein
MIAGKGTDFSIANGQSLSNAIDLKENGLCGLYMPAAWDAADLTLVGATSLSGTYQNVNDKDGTEMLIKAAASRFILLNPADFAGLRFLKLRSGTSGAAVAQTAARTISPMLRRLV